MIVLSRLQISKQAYAAGVYLFAEHHMMLRLHEDMAVCLDGQTDNAGVTREGEAAYHIHQMLVRHISMFGRYGGVVMLSS